MGLLLLGKCGCPLCYLNVFPPTHIGLDLGGSTQSMGWGPSVWGQCRIGAPFLDARGCGVRKEARCHCRQVSLTRRSIRLPLHCSQHHPKHSQLSPPGVYRFPILPPSLFSCCFKIYFLGEARVIFSKCFIKICHRYRKGRVP